MGMFAGKKDGKEISSWPQGRGAQPSGKSNCKMGLKKLSGEAGLCFVGSR